MLRSLKELHGYTCVTRDGGIGSVSDFFFDDERWAIRYLVVRTGGLLHRRFVLISPIAFGRVDWSGRHFHLQLTREKVEGSPTVDADKPVSRQHEQEYARYYGYPPYWGYQGLWGMAAYPMALATQQWDTPPDAPSNRHAANDVHLRSANEVRGYHVQGSDDAIGHVEDFVVDDETWAVRYLVIDTKNWWFGKEVLVDPKWASRISWADRKVHIDLSRREIEQSPEWDPSAGVDRQYEIRLYDYYGRPGYWIAPDPHPGQFAPKPSGARST